MSNGLRVTNGHLKIVRAIDDDRLRALWVSEMPIMDVCWELNAFHSAVTARARKLGLGRRPHPDHLARDVDPTEQEIVERCEAIQTRYWTPEERDRRRQGAGICQWEPPAVSVR